MRGGQVNRRELIGLVAAGASAAFVCAPAIAQGARHRHWRRLRWSYMRATTQTIRSEIQVTLVETNPTFTACPFSKGGSCRLPRVQCSAIHL